jgi:hypothetical protein
MHETQQDKSSRRNESESKFESYKKHTDIYKTCPPDDPDSIFKGSSSADAAPFS